MMARDGSEISTFLMIMGGLAALIVLARNRPDKAIQLGAEYENSLYSKKYQRWVYFSVHRYWELTSDEIEMIKNYDEKEALPQGVIFLRFQAPRAIEDCM